MSKMEGRPDILTPSTDLRRCDTVASLGGSSIKTQHSARLRADAPTYDSGFSPSPVRIVATRSVINGRYPIHAGRSDNTIIRIHGSDTVVDALQEFGFGVIGGRQMSLVGLAPTFRRAPDIPAGPPGQTNTWLW
jgi:hypothetical protein